MRRLVVLSVVAIGVLTGGLAFYLFWVGTLLNRVAANLEESADLVHEIDDHAKVIGPGVTHVNRVGGVVAGALPLLYGMAEQIVRGVAPAGARDSVKPENAASPRRSRLQDGVGFTPPGELPGSSRVLWVASCVSSWQLALPAGYGRASYGGLRRLAAG